MSPLAFNGFLKQYIKAISYCNSCSIYKLAAEAASNNLRLREPLFLYALFSGKQNLLLAATKSSELHEEYTMMLKKYSIREMENALLSDDPLLPREYRKAYHSYFSVINKNKTDAKTKLLMRDKIVRLQAEKNISTYRLYTDLHINHGNMNAFIKYGDCSKVSYHTALRALEYMDAK